LLLNVSGKLTKQERGELYDLLHSRGYIIYHFNDFEVDTEIKQIDREEMNKWKHFDFLAVHKEESRIGTDLMVIRVCLCNQNASPAAYAELGRQADRRGFKNTAEKSQKKFSAPSGKKII
jgi:hypothetical protein